ncbi:hypothetical protein AHF37_07922 [Paragonimus kellicotti]|nr:hypothetical protein AHF37_07922 [Paragonimus kellicotti]
MDHAELRGLDHLWRLLLDAPDAVASQAMQLLEHLYSNLTTRLIPRQAELHEDLVLHCLTRLRADFDTIRLLLNSGTDSSSADLCRTVERVARVIQLLRHCLRMGENATEKCVRLAQKLPLKRAWMGSSIVFTVTFGLPPGDSHGQLDSSSLPPSPIPSTDGLGTTSMDSQAPNTILFVAHANMTVGELRSQLLSFRLRALRAKSISSDLPVADLQHYNLDLYVNHSERQQTNSSGLFFSLNNNLSNCLLDPAADSQLVFNLLPLFDHWPTGFLVDYHHQAGSGSEPPPLKLTANVVLASSKFSYDFNKHTLLMTADPSKSSVSTVPSVNTMVSRSEHPNTVPTAVEHCYAEPPPDVQLLLSTATEPVAGSSTKEGELDLSSPERRSNFLLQVAKLAMELNNSTLFSSVLDVLLCMPAPNSLIERLRLDIATSAQISASDTSKCLLSDWVTVPAQF